MNQFRLTRSRIMFCQCLMLLVVVPSFAQSKLFTVLDANSKSLPKAVEKVQNIKKISIVQLNEASLRNYLQVAPLEFHNNGVTLPLEIPLPNGTIETFGMVESPVLSPEQAALHPEIKTYTGNGQKNKKYIVRLSLTANGFNAIILNVEDDAVYFEPYSKADRNYYFSYFSRDAFIPKQLRHLSDGCGVGSLRRQNGSVDVGGHLQKENTPENNTGASLKTYRIAIAATGEFTQAQAGADDAAKTTAALSSLAEYVNRMNAVYRNEICVQFSLVSGTSVIYANAGTDPYTHTDSGVMLGQCQTDLDAKVMTANYDVGHVIGQSSGSGEGLAQGNSVCSAGDKAKGVTKIGGTPFAQVFFDQTLFHEVGHQFGMNHSYNSSIPVCTTRNQPTSVEPGAGATIMSYGFTCDGDDYFSSTTNGPILVFHTINYSEMVTFMAAGGNCPSATTATGNNVPVVTEPANYTIPKSTPFALTGSATDADGDGLTYSWEGMNLGEVAAPVAGTLADLSKPPFFRTYEPTTGGATRNFPLLSAILNGSNYAKGDKLPSVAIATTHRLTVRDNRAGGGSTAFKEVTVTVDGTAGPFLETTNLGGSYAGNSTQTITWSVNGTDQAPINVANVKISISTDGGMTFPTVLLASTPNDGTESVTLPNVATSTARIKVEAVGNIFFDISNANFTITSTLPVELVDVQAKLVGTTSQVTWQTAAEVNVLGFDIERLKNDGQTYGKLGFVKATGNAANYSFIDAAPRQGINYYRLKMVDNDGRIAYSKTVSVQLGNSKMNIKVFPSPTEGVISIVNDKSEMSQVSVFNSIGQLVYVNKSTNRVDLTTMPTGIYFVEVQSGSEKVVEKVFKK